MSRIYASGVRATAIANIKTDVGAFFIAGTDGVKRLDRSLLASYLMTQFALMATTDGTPPNAPLADVDAAARAIPVMPLVDTLDNALRPERFRQLPDYPANYGQVSGAALVAAIKVAQAKTAAAAAEVTSLFRWTQTQQLLDGVKNAFDELELDSNIPKGIERVERTLTFRYVYRTDKGEMSKPSDASALVTVDQNDTVTLTATTPPVGRNVTDILWYAANSNNSGAAFQYAATVAVATSLSYSFALKGEQLGEPCPSLEWDEPNTDLRGIRAHPNGYGVAFFGNTLCASVANRMYAWPVNYRKTTRKPIVGIELSGQTIFVGTQGEPYLATGADPAFIAMERVKGGHACRAARSIVASSIGFIYAGPSGLVRCVGVNDTDVLTEQHWTKEQWEALAPDTMFAVEHDNCYYLWTNSGTVCYSLSLKDFKLGTVDITASAAFVNTANGKLYFASGTTISEAFGGSTRRIGIWKSPRINLSKAGSFAWRKMIGDYEASSITLTVTRHFIKPDGTTSSDTVTQTVGNRNAARWPAGKPDEYEIQLSGRSSVTTLVLAGDTADLRA